jgi:hypothetical protein
VGSVQTGILIAIHWFMENQNIQKSTEQEEDNVLDTSGGEMPDADLKMRKASEAAEAFERTGKDRNDQNSKEEKKAS